MFNFERISKQRFGHGSRFEGRKVLSVSNKTAYFSNDAAEALNLRPKTKVNLGWDERAQAIKVSKTMSDDGWSLFSGGENTNGVSMHSAGLNRMNVIKGDYIMLDDQPGIFVLADRLQ